MYINGICMIAHCVREMQVFSFCDNVENSRKHVRYNVKIDTSQYKMCRFYRLCRVYFLIVQFHEPTTISPKNSGLWKSGFSKRSGFHTPW